MRELCAKLETEFDYVLMDCPAGIEQGFKNAVGAATEAILVTTPEVSAIRDADRVIGLLEASEVHRPRLIINRIHPDMVKQGNMMDKDDIVELLAVDVLGLVPADDRTITAANRGVPVVHDKKAPSGAAFPANCGPRGRRRSAVSRSWTARREWSARSKSFLDWTGGPILMLDLFRWLLGQLDTANGQERSKDTARQRLSVVLIQDRLDLPAEKMDLMKQGNLGSRIPVPRSG